LAIVLSACLPFYDFWLPLWYLQSFLVDLIDVWGYNIKWSRVAPVIDGCRWISSNEFSDHCQMRCFTFSCDLKCSTMAGSKKKY
jgi:hypothetical protein